MPELAVHTDARMELGTEKRPSNWRAALLRPRRLILLLVLMILAVIGTVVVLYKPRIRVGRETTYFVEPLDDKGFVDYSEALDRKHSADVSPEENAAVVLARTMDPAKVSAKVRAKNHQFKIEFARPGEPIFNYFVPASATDYPRRREHWTAEKYPAVAKWVETHTAKFDLAVEASQRTRYFHPIDDDGAFLSDGLHLCHGLAFRATLRLEQGDAAGAWSDLLAVHRLSRLVAACPSRVSVSFALALHSIAVEGTVALVNSPVVGEPLAKRMLKELQELGPLPRMIDAHESERCAHLRFVQAAFRGRERLNIHGGTNHLAKRIPDWMTHREVNWSLVLKHVNEWYDRLEAIAAIPSRPGRRAALKLMFDELRLVPPSGWAEAGLFGSHAMARSQTVFFAEVILMAADMDEKAAARQVVLETQLATRLWQMRHGTDPKKVEDLVPEFLPEPPIDPFTELPLRLVDASGEIRIYSLWVNGTDDGGVQTNDSPWPDGDFIAPLPTVGADPSPKR